MRAMEKGSCQHVQEDVTSLAPRRALQYTHVNLSSMPIKYL